MDIEKQKLIDSAEKEFKNRISNIVKLKIIEFEHDMAKLILRESEKAHRKVIRDVVSQFSNNQESPKSFNPSESQLLNQLSKNISSIIMDNI